MNIALYTTIYPGVELFLKDWKQSVFSQTEKEFDIWVGVDGFSLSEAERLLHDLNCKKIIVSERPNVKAYIRKKVLIEIVKRYDAVVLVDSDDVLKPSRVARAKEQLFQYDVVGCAMQLIDAEGKDLEVRFGRSHSAFHVEDIIEFNQYGLSNTAYRCDILMKCLNVPEECELFDWFLITKAWLLAANIYFDPVERMAYRQHAKNATKILPPFDAQSIHYATECVLKHFSILLSHDEILSNSRRKIIEDRQNSVFKFRDQFLNNPTFSKTYTQAYNELSQDRLWWSCVANQNLESVWNQ